MVRTQIQLTEFQAQDLKQVALEKSVSMAAVIREAVDSYLLGSGTDAGAVRRKRALSAIGAFEGGLRLAQEHDAAFSEADAQ
ncbi:MAG: CopG family transcriptional regulator [Lentisphaeria bacterium]|nr:CopG family transcriptional regulator [Lentisphaeria bacterium]